MYVFFLFLSMEKKLPKFFIFKTFLLIFVGIFVEVKSGFAQLNPPVSSQNWSEEQKKIVRDKWNAAQGTFQFQIVNSRVRPQIDVAIIEQILEKRQLSELFYLPYTENVRILILPQSELNSPDFKPLELFKYVQN